MNYICSFQSIDAKAQKALECPCIADLRKGSCGSQFSEAFLCFLKSTAEEKVSAQTTHALQYLCKQHETKIKSSDNFIYM